MTYSRIIYTIVLRKTCDSGAAPLCAVRVLPIGGECDFQGPSCFTATITSYPHHLMAQTYACRCVNVKILGDTSEDSTCGKYICVNVRDDDLQVVSIAISFVASSAKYTLTVRRASLISRSEAGSMKARAKIGHAIPL